MPTTGEVKHALRAAPALPTIPEMVPTAPSLAQVISDGSWLAHRYDEAGDAIQFRFVPREAQRGMTFLTDHEIGDAPLAVYARADCLAEVPNARLITATASGHDIHQDQPELVIDAIARVVDAVRDPSTW